MWYNISINQTYTATSLFLKEERKCLSAILESACTTQLLRRMASLKGFATGIINFLAKCQKRSC